MAFTYRDAAGAGFQAACQDSIEDLFSKYKCKQTFGLLYLDRNKADITDLPTIISELHLESADIIGVQRDTEKFYSRLLVKLKDDAMLEFDRIKDMDGEIITLRRNFGDVKIMIQDMTSCLKYVAVAGIPFEVPNDAVAALMSRFGDVKGIRMNYYKSILNGIATGTRIVKMNMKRNIPSVIRVGNKTLNISYENQIKTCYRCGMDDHLGNECRTKEEERIHIINDTDYPLLKSNEMTETVPEVVMGETAVAVTPIPAAEPMETVVDAAAAAAEAADAAAVGDADAAAMTAAAAAAETADAAATKTATDVDAAETAAVDAAPAAKPEFAKVSTESAQDIEDITKIETESKEETDIQEEKNDIAKKSEDNMIKDQVIVSQKDTVQKENEKSILSPQKKFQQVKKTVIKSPSLPSKAKNGTVDEMTCDEITIKNLTLNSPAPLGGTKGNTQLSRKPESSEKKKKRKSENGNSKETASTVEDRPQDVKINDSKRHFVKNVDSSCDSQMIPGNQLGFSSPSSSNKRSNMDNMTKSSRNVKSKFSNV